MIVADNIKDRNIPTPPSLGIKPICVFLSSFASNSLFLCAIDTIIGVKKRFKTIGSRILSDILNT